MPSNGQTSEIIWHIEPRWRDVLLADSRLTLENWLRSEHAEKIKDGKFRTIYRVRAGNLDLHIKHCRPLGLRAWLREWLRPAKALLEFRRIREVARRNVPTLKAVAYGVGRGLGPADSFLITESLTNTISLTQFLHASPSPGPRRILAKELGRFLATLHQAGVCHTDLHPGNVLMHWNDGRPHFVLIDLHDVRVGRPLSLKDSLNNLIVFNRWFVLRSSRTDRLRCWRAYCQARRASDPSWRQTDSRVAAELEQRTWRSNRRFWAGRMSRCLRATRYFHRLRGAGIDGFAVRDLERADIAPILLDPDAIFGKPIAPLLKDSRSSTVAELDLIVGSQTRRVIVKRFRVTSRWDPVAALLRPTACWRSWVNGHAFLDCLLPSPRPLAFWHRRRRGLSWEGYLIVEKAENAVDLHAFLSILTTRPAHERAAVLWRRVEQLADWVRQMHWRGWSHRDLKASNILLSSENAEQISFIDLVGARRGRITNERRQRNLARLNASFVNQPLLSRTDRLRFLRIYLSWGLAGRGDWKSWWRRIALLTERKRQRNQLRGRPLA